MRKVLPLPWKSGSELRAWTSAAVSFTQASYVGDTRKQYAGYSRYGRAGGCVDISYCVVDV
jgi:hypothetical protein